MSESSEQIQKPLTGKQKAFAEYYLGEAKFHLTNAALLAGYSEKAAHSIASENIKKPAIRRYIDGRLSEMTLGKNEVLALLTDIARSSIEDISDDAGQFDYQKAKKAGKLKLVKKLKRKSTTSKDGNVEEIEFEMYSSYEALRDLGKYHKVFADRVEHSGPDGGPLQVMSSHDLSKLSVDELLQYEQLLRKTRDI